MVYDLGTHLMDQCIVLFGFPDRVTGVVTAWRAGERLSEDNFTILLHYDRVEGKREQPLLCTVKAGIVSPEVEQMRYWVRGTKGSFKKYHLDCQEPQLVQGTKPTDAKYGVEPEDRWGTLTTWNEGSPEQSRIPTVEKEPVTYTEYYRRVARALAGERDQIPVDAEHAIGLIKLVELARESSKEGKTLEFVMEPFLPLQ